MVRLMSFPGRPSYLLAVALAVAGLSAPAHRTQAATRLRAPELFPISSPGVTPGDLAVGDVDGDGIPEIATYASDLKVHVYARVQGRWTEVYVSTTAALYPEYAPVPTVRFTDIADIAPGAGYDPGQFLFSALSGLGNTIVSIRRSGGAWSEQAVVEPHWTFPAKGTFSPPVRLQAEYNSAPAWRLAVPGKYYFDPPMGIYLPEFGQSAPYPAVKHTLGPSGYCTQGLGSVAAADAADVNGNGINELALIINSNELWVANTWSASSLPGDACWSFEKFTIPGSPYPNVQLISGRFDADAAGDMVVRNSAGQLCMMRGTPGQLPYLLQATTLTSSVPAPASCTDMDIADLDRDGDLDIVQVFSSPAGYEVLLNDGTGAFTESFTPFPNPADTVASVALADADGDSTVDLVMSMSSAANPRVLILPGRGDGSFGVPSIALGTLDPASIAIADFNDDLMNDVAVGGWDLELADGFQPMQVRLNAGGGGLGGSLAVEAQYPLSAYVRRVVPYRPSATDPVWLSFIAGSSSASVHGNGDGTMQPFYPNFQGNPLTGLDVADLDGDGFGETIRLEMDDAAGYSIVTLERPFDVPVTLNLPGAYDGVRAVDWDSDGLLDLVTLNLDLSQLEVWLMDPGAIWSFLGPNAYPVTVPLDGWTGGGWQSFIVMPFASGSTHRVVVVRSGPGSGTRQLEVIRNSGTPNAGSYDVAVGSSGVLAGIAGGDVDGDGVPDIVAAENVDWRHGFLRVMRGVASVPDSFETNATFMLPGRVITDLAIGDVTGDGFDDLVTVTNQGLGLMPQSRRTDRASGTASTGELAVFPALPIGSSTVGLGDSPHPRPLPTRLALSIWPNPTRGDAARVSFDLPSAGQVSAALYDLSGRRVRELFDGRRDAGRYTESFSIRDASGRPLGTGVYFVRVRAGAASAARRIVVVR